MREGIKNIYAVFRQADEIDRREGMLAYSRYNTVCHRLADHYGYTFEEVVAVFAATSPNSDYKGNLRSTATILQAYKAGVPHQDINIATYRACLIRAYSYLDGVSFLYTVTGDKIFNFYWNIVNPENPFPVTIDGHAVNMYRNQVNRLNDVEARITHKQYQAIADDFKKVARKEKMLPNQLQAITWFTWKRINNIIYKPQGHLFFGQDDYWQTLMKLEDIKPFEYGKTNRSINGNLNDSDSGGLRPTITNRNPVQDDKTPDQANLFT
jgi:hypothetical protein